MNHARHRISRPAAAGLVALALLTGAAAAVMAGAARSTFPQPGAQLIQYAVLTHYDCSASAPNTGSGSWMFEDRTGRYDARVMDKLLGIAENEDNRAVIINAIAAKGWELVTYTDAPVHEPDFVNNGNSGPGKLRRTEQWWFKKR